MTKPVDDTMIVGLLLDHTTVRPVSVLPLASWSVAVNCAVCAVVIVLVGGVTVTVCTGASTTVVFVPDAFRWWL